LLDSKRGTIMATKITKRAVDAASADAPPNDAKGYHLIWDSEVKGFGLKVIHSKEKPGPDGQAVKSGGKKIYILQYRMGGRGTPTKRYTIGEHGALTPDDARKEAERLKGLVRSGKDPRHEKRAIQDAHRRDNAAKDSVESVGREFVQRHLPQRKSGPETARILEREVFPKWGGQPIGGVKRSDVLTLLDRIADRGAPYARNRAAATIRKLFNWAIGRGYLEANPAAGVEMLDEEASDRVLSDEEIVRVWNACDVIGWPFGTVFRILLLTAQRRDEVAEMRWTEVDLKAALWTLPKERAKNNRAHEVPLAPHVVEILSALPRIEESGLVFTTNGKTPVSGFSKAKRRLDELAGVKDWRLHDLRRTATTGMAKLGVEPHVADRILNHKQGVIRGVAAVYNRHAYLDERREALNRWADYVLRLLKPTDAKVVVLRA
jgi:integrase